MSLFQKIKALFGPPPKRKSGATITIFGPFQTPTAAYVVERAARQRKLNGWLKSDQLQTIEMELEGDRDEIEGLLTDLNRSKLIPGKPTVEMIWLPFHARFHVLTLSIVGHVKPVPWSQPKKLP